jgi:hypothetical protein
MPKRLALPDDRRPPSGGGPEDPMLELRLARVEDILVKLEPMIVDVARNGARQSELQAVRIDLAELKGRVHALPTWWMLLVTVIATWGAGSSIVFAIARWPLQ